MPEALDNIKKRKDGSLQYRLFCMVLLGACLVFFTSSLWLPDAQKIMHSAGGAVSDSSPYVSLKLAGWEYNPDTRYLEAGFYVEQKGASTPRFSPSAYDIGAPQAPLDVAVAYYGSGVLFLQIRELPKDWEILSLWVSDDSGQPFMEADALETTDANAREKAGANFKCDRRKVHQNLSLAQKTERDYAIKAVLYEIDFLKQNIRTAEQSVQKKKAQEDKIKEEIAAIRADQTYQTGEEKRDSDTVIRQQEQELERCKTEAAELQERLREYREKIAKLQQKITAIRSETG